jgi:hypothetical protein
LILGQFAATTAPSVAEMFALRHTFAADAGHTSTLLTFKMQVAFRRHAVTPERFGGAVSAASASTSNMLALMEAWSQLSTHLQQRPQPESVISSDDVSSDASTDASDASYASDSSSDAETSQLILAALKLAVRSLSRTVSDNSTSSGSSGGNSSPSTGFLQDRPPAGNDPALPAVQRSLALAVALAELYAAGLPLDGASIAAGIVAEAVDVSALHINTVQAKLGHEVAALVHDVLAVRHAPERTQSYDDASSRCAGLLWFVPNPVLGYVGAATSLLFKAP